MANAHLGGNDFTLFYDYDELREGKLYSLNDNEQIEWFKLRMTMGTTSTVPPAEYRKV